MLDRWGLAGHRGFALAFGETVIEASLRSCAAVKPNIAFFERHGSQGIAALERVLALAREQGLITILDAKRGDIGSTMQAYAEAYFTPWRAA